MADPRGAAGPAGAFVETTVVGDAAGVGKGGGGKPDIIVSGHEHRPVVERYDGLLHINSGSPTLLEYREGLGTVGVLELGPGKAEASIIRLSKT